MTTYKATGTIVDIGEVKTFGSGFTKRELVVNVSTSNYDSPVPFNLKKDKCDLANALKVGDRVEVEFTIDGRKWDGPNGVRYFTDITAWKVTPEGGVATSAPAQPAAAVDPVDTDLPF